jgi:hypothetical protein
VLKVTSIVGTMRKASLIAALPLLLNACADDITGPVNAYVAKGPITGSECRLFRADNNTQLAAAGETVEGFVDFGNVAFSGVGYVECTGGSYMDEATAGTVDASGLTLRSAKRFAGGTTFIVTPLTEIAARKAEAASGGIEANVENFNNSVADNFGLSALDITSVQPTDLSTTPARNNPEGWYGTVLAGISQLDMTNTGEDISGVIDILEDSPDLSSGDFKDALDGLSGNDNINDDSDVTDSVQGGLGSNPDGSPGQENTGSTGSTPKINSIFPSAGSAAGGFEFVIIGTGYEAGDSLDVTVGGKAATVVTVDSSTQVRVTAPSGDAGSVVDVVLTNGDGQAVTFADALTYVAAGAVPTVVSISPSTGSEAGGTDLTITGTNFVAGDSLGVVVGGNLASVVAENNFASNVTLVSSTQITATTPPGTAGDVDVVVVNGDGQIAIAEGAFTYVAGDAPTITSISPAAGTAAGGTQLMISGANFVVGDSFNVTVGGQAATGVTVDSATQITVTTPSGTAGSVVDVEVTSGDGQVITASGSFTYVALDSVVAVDGVSPSAGPEAGGTQLTISGANFVAGDRLSVTVDGQAATGVTVDSATQITATTPSGTAGAAVDVVVTNGDGQVVLIADAFTYTDGSGPLIDSVSPATGSEAGGTQLTITGTNYATGGSLSVTVDGQAATGVTVDSSTQITAITPSGTAGSAVDVVVVNGDGQDVTATGAFTYQGACQHCELDANGCPF